MIPICCLLLKLIPLIRIRKITRLNIDTSMQGIGQGIKKNIQSRRFSNESSAGLVSLAAPATARDQNRDLARTGDGAATDRRHIPPVFPLSRFGFGFVSISHLGRFTCCVYPAFTSFLTCFCATLIRKLIFSCSSLLQIPHLPYATPVSFVSL